MTAKPEPRKKCSGPCQDYKKLSEFHKEKAKPLGVQSRCRPCHLKENSERREKLRKEKEEEKARNTAESIGVSNDKSNEAHSPGT
jgi:hypothetical protein